MKTVLLRSQISLSDHTFFPRQTTRPSVGVLPGETISNLIDLLPTTDLMQVGMPFGDKGTTA